MLFLWTLSSFITASVKFVLYVIGFLILVACFGGGLCLCAALVKVVADCFKKLIKH